MATLKFKKADVFKLLAVLKKTDKITLVGDQGVYLMSFGEPLKVLPEDGPRTLAYAEGCNPELDEDFYDNKDALYGGDDGGDDIGTAGELALIAVQAKSHVIVKLTATQIKVGSI